MYVITFKFLSRWKHRRIRVVAPAGLSDFQKRLTVNPTLSISIVVAFHLATGHMPKPLTIANMAISIWHIIAGIFGIPVFLLCLCILVSECIRCFKELKQLWREYKNGELSWFSIFILFSLLRHIIFCTTLNLFYYGTHWFFETRCTVCWYAAY